MLRKYTPFLFAWLFGAFCLLVPALYNGYPLVTADSGAYIDNSYTLFVPIDRPLGYSIFIRLTCLDISLWGAVIVQALIVSGLLLLLIRRALDSAYTPQSGMAILAMVGICTSAGWTCGQLTPDIFTAILFLSISVLLLVPISRPAQWAMWLLVFVCIVVHNSNLLISMILAASLLLLRWRRPTIRRTAIGLLAACVVGWLSLSTLTSISGRGFRPSSATHAFIMSRMAENGILDTYLNEYCATDRTSLCDFQHKIPNRQWEFMWGNPGPFYATGGWEGTEKEYNHIIRKTLTRPKYLAMHLVKNAEATLRQLPLLHVGEELAPLGTGSSPYNAIDKWIYHELKEYASSLQVNRELKLEQWNPLIVLFELAACLGLLVFYSDRRINGDTPILMLRSALKLTVLFLLVNAAITATFATVVARYEARVFWLLPLFSILYIIRLRNKPRQEPV